MSTYNAQKCDIKNDNFKTIIRLSDGFIAPRDRQYLLLDSPRLDNVKMLCDYFGKGENKRAMVVEMERKVFNRQRRTDIKLGHHFQEKLKQIIIAKEKPLKDVSIIYLDFMSSPYGNSAKQQYPLEDLWKILQQSKQKRLTIGITLCCARLQTEFHEKTVRTLNTLIGKQIIPSCQYKIVKSHTPRRYYRKTGGRSDMFFAVYNLEKDTSIQTNNVDHFVKVIDQNDEKSLRFLGFSKEFDQLINVQ